METSSLCACVFNDNSFINSRNKYVIFLDITSELFEQISNSILNSLSLSRVSKIFNLLRKALHVNKCTILRPTARSLRPTGSFLWGGEPPPPHLRPWPVAYVWVLSGGMLFPSENNGRTAFHLWVAQIVKWKLQSWLFKIMYVLHYFEKLFIKLCYTHNSVQKCSV
jgi:hypothetical protein